MASVYDEVEIEDFDYDEKERAYFYPCPCGDKFRITKVIAAMGRLGRPGARSSPPSQEELLSGEDLARCPSCSLIVRVVFDPVRVGGGRSRPASTPLTGCAGGPGGR